MIFFEKMRIYSAQGGFRYCKLFVKGQQIFLSSILSKNERKYSDLVAWSKLCKYFVRFLEELGQRYFAFEIF